MIKIRKITKKDVATAGELVALTYCRFNYREGKKADIEKYTNHFRPAKNDLLVLEKYFLKAPICYVLEDSQKIIGVIRGNKNRLTNLFVDGDYHGQGLGKKLIQKFESQAKILGSKQIKIRASLYALPFYLKMGYRKTTGLRIFKGLQHQPIIKKI